MTTNGKPIPTCRHCHAEIRWVYPRWRKGALPLSRTEITSTDEALMLYTGGGHILRRAKDGEAMTGYPCHFDLCPHYMEKKRVAAESA